jgi:hypothetical protein
MGSSTVGEEAGESPVYAEKSKACLSEGTPRQRTRPQKEPDVPHRWLIAYAVPPPF